MSNVSSWTTSAAGNNSASPDGFPEGMNPSGVNDSAREVMSAVRRWYVDAEWINWGDTLVRQTNNSFLVSRTATDVYTAGRRLKLYDSTTIYGNVISSSPSGANTIVTVSSSNLSSSLSSGAVGILNPQFSSDPLFTPGLIFPYGGSTVPAGWLACDGSAVSRTTYAALFAAIGTTWGVGDGATTFNVPDLRGRTLIGSGTGSGLTARTVGTQNIGEETHILTTNEMPAHNHPTTRGNGGTSNGAYFSYNGSTGTQTTDSATTAMQNTGGGAAHNVMQPSAVVTYMIRV